MMYICHCFGSGFFSSATATAPSCSPCPVGTFSASGASIRFFDYCCIIMMRIVDLFIIIDYEQECVRYVLLVIMLTNLVAAHVKLVPLVCCTISSK